MPNIPKFVILIMAQRRLAGEKLLPFTPTTKIILSNSSNHSPAGFLSNDLPDNLFPGLRRFGPANRIQCINDNYAGLFFIPFMEDLE